MAKHANIASEEDKNKLKESFKKFMEAIRSLFNKRSIVERMEKMQNEMDYMLAQNGLTEDAVKELTETFNTMSGKLHTITPENVDKVMDDLNQKVNDIISKRDILETSENLSEEFLDKIKEHFKITDKDKDFENDFLRNSKVILIDDDDNHAIFKYREEFLKIELQIKEHQPTVLISTFPNGSNIFEKNGELKKGYSFAEAPEEIKYNSKLTMLNSLCERQGINFAYDKEKEKLRILEEIKKDLSPSATFLSERYESVTQETGNLESIYKREDASFRVRDKVTGEMLRITSDKNKMQVYLSQNTKDFDDTSISKEVLLGEWEQKNKGILAGTFKLSLGSDNVTAILKSDVMKEWFKLNGISEGVQAQSFHHKTDSKAAWSKVNSAKMKDVIALQEACAASIANNHVDEKIIASVYETTPKRKSNDSYTFLNIVKDEGMKEGNPKLSISFNKDGTPLTINYNNQFAYNIAARTTSDDYHKVLWNDPTFRELFNIAVDGLKEKGLDKGIEKFGELSYKSADSYEKATYTPSYNAVPMAKRELTDSSISFNENKYADVINKLALKAINQKTLSLKDVKQAIKEEKFSPKFTPTPKQVLDTLVALEVVKDNLKHDSLMNEQEYVQKIDSLAMNPKMRKEYADLSFEKNECDNFTAALTDAYEKFYQLNRNPYIVLNESEYSLGEQTMTAIRQRLSNGHETISAGKLARMTGKDTDTTMKIVSQLERMGILNNDKILVSVDDIDNLKKSALKQESEHNIGTKEYADSITEAVMFAIENGSATAEEISTLNLNPSTVDVLHTLEELGVVSADSSHEVLVTRDEYAQIFKDENLDSFKAALALSYTDFLDNEHFVSENTYSEPNIEDKEPSFVKEEQEDRFFDALNPIPEAPEERQGFDPSFLPDEDDIPVNPYEDNLTDYWNDGTPEPPEEPDYFMDLE